MPETHGTIEAIEQWEEHCRNLVRLGIAELVHDSSKNIKPQFHNPDGDIVDYVRVYHVLVGSGINSKAVAWRFHYDKRPGAESHLRITERGLKRIWGSWSVNSAAQRLNKEVSTDNGCDMEKLKEIMDEAIKIVAERKRKTLTEDKAIFSG
jgi:hypothetical protein